MPSLRHRKGRAYRTKVCSNYKGRSRAAFVYVGRTLLSAAVDLGSVLGIAQFSYLPRPERRINSTGAVS